MAMIGPLVLMLLMLNYTYAVDIDLNDPGNNWKKPYGYNQYGHQIFPDKNGCGGVIEVTEDYQYGILTSPNWPEDLPSHVHCVWKLSGLTSFFFAVNAFPGDTKKDINQSSGILIVQNLAMKREERFYMGGYHLHHVAFLNNSLQSFEIRMTSNVYTGQEYTRSGFQMTWWTVPRADFSKIYSSDQWKDGKYQDNGDFALRNDTIGYVFLNNIGPSTVTLAMLANEGGRHLDCTPSKVSLSEIRFEKRIKSVYSDICKPEQKDIWIESQAYEPSLVGIEITLPENVNLKYYFTGSQSPSREPPSWAWIHRECPVQKPGDMKGVGYIYTANFNNSDKTYRHRRHCHEYLQIPPDVQDVFMQVNMQTEIQPSPSCVANYLKIGSQRVCGINGPDTYISSPVDNSLIDRTETYYMNIVPNNASVFASHHVSENHTAQLALNADLSQCYVSHYDVFSPYWVMDLDDVFTVHGIQVVPEPSTNTTIAVYVKSDEVSLWPVSSYQTCWLDPYRSYSGIKRCNPPVSGRYLTIFKTTPRLEVCKVQVFVNIASPLKAWTNAVYDKEPEIHTEANISIHHKHRLVDGDPLTCIEELFEPDDYLKFTLSDDDLTVHAVMLYFQSAEQTVAFQSYGIIHLKSDNRIEPVNSVCVNYDGPTDQQGAILLSCQLPLRTPEFFISNITNGTTLCEVIVYADTKDKAKNYAALHKPAFHLLSSNESLLPANGFSFASSTPAPDIVDGNMRSCDSSHQFFLDLLTLHVVEGVKLHFGNQKGRVFVRVLVFHYNDSINEIKPEPLCKEYLGNDYKDHMHMQHEKLKLSLKCATPKVGRYVILYITKFNASVLHLCELQVIATPYDNHKGFQNVALFKHAQLGPKSNRPRIWDPSHFFYYGNGARHAVDGEESRNTTILTCTTVLAERDTEAWWEVDLANMYEVGSVQYFLCSDHANTSFAITIFVSRELPPSRYYAGARTNHVTISPPVLGRIVQLVSSHHMCLCEVKVMAKPLLSYKLFGGFPWFIDGRLTQSFSFVTDKYIHNNGFLASYKINNLRDFKSFAACGELLRGTLNALRSPNYPYTYALPDDNYICHWMLPTPYDGFIFVKIDHMDLAQPMGEYKCFYDVLIISNSAGQQITKCGYMTNRSLSIQSFEKDYLHVTLIVRKETPINRTGHENKGFELHFTPYKSCAYQFIPLRMSVTGHLSSPLYPHHHPPFAWCSWTMNAYTLGMLRITILALNLLQTRQGCGDEVLTIHRSGQELQTFCGDSPPLSALNITLQTGDTVTIVFKSTENVNRKGFHLSYTFNPLVDAHSVLLGYNTTDIQSLGYPNTYDPENVTLTWILTTLDNSGDILLNFTDLHLWSNGSARPGSAHFSVDNYLTISSKRLTLNTRKYNDSTKPEDRYSTFPVYPQSVFELKFKPDRKKGKHNVKFRFSLTFVPDAFTDSGPRVFVGEDAELDFDKRPTGIRFSQINLKENMAVYDRRYVFTVKTGLYLVSIRVLPFGLAHKADLELLLNLRQIDLIAYSSHVSIGSMTATLELKTGDMLSVKNANGLAERLTTFTVVYISPVQGGCAFTGFLEKARRILFQKIKGPYVRIITNSGYPSKIYTPKYNTFIAPETGIYWVTIRTNFNDLTEYVTLHKGETPTFLVVWSQGDVPSSSSAAIHFTKGDLFSVHASVLTRSLFSVILLVYNKKPHTGKYRHIAITATTGYETEYKESDRNIEFHYITVQFGIRVRDKSKFTIPIGGLYLVSIRNDLPSPDDDDECLSQHLSIKVNGTTIYVGVAIENAPGGQMTVIRLKAKDVLTVSPKQNDRVDKGIMFSVAFVSN